MLQPMLKVSIPYFVANDSVHFRLAGQLTSLEDSHGRVLALLKLLDGTRAPDVIWRALSAQFPDVAERDVQDAIVDLDHSGLLQDATDQGMDFTAVERERWTNNLGFFETYASLTVSKYEFQRRIRDAKVAVLGVGGIGTHVLIDLVAIGFTDIRIVDFDRIEVSNFNRQIIYGEPDLGRLKIEVAAERARALNSAVRIDGIETRLASADDVYQVVHDRDIVIAVVDRPKLHMAHWLNEGCVRAGTPFISGGVDTQRAMHYCVVPGVSGCVECWYNYVQTNDSTSRMVRNVMEEIARDGNTFGEDTAAFNGLVTMGAGLMVNEMVRMISQASPPLSVGRMLGLTFHDPRLREIESWKRDDVCRTCGGTQPRDELRWLDGGNVRGPF